MKQTVLPRLSAVASLLVLLAACGDSSSSSSGGSSGGPISGEEGLSSGAEDAGESSSSGKQAVGEPPLVYVQHPEITCRYGEVCPLEGHARDDDGEILLYEWDFDGDGEVDESNPDNDFAHVYSGSANPELVAFFCARDDDGNRACDSTVVHLVNEAPVLKGFLRSDRGRVTCNDDGCGFEPAPYVSAGTSVVVFADSLRIEDADGNAVDSLYWDMDGDGEFEKATGLSDTVVLRDVRTNATRTVAVRARDLCGLWTGEKTLTHFFNGSSANPCENGSFRDGRDGRSYRCVEIGRQTWMAQNLDFGERVDGAVEQSASSATSAQKYCYNDSAAHCSATGGLYQWHTVMALPVVFDSLAPGDEFVDFPHRGICPEGWHVPTHDEWTELKEHVVSLGVPESEVGQALKSTTGWTGSAGNGSDEVGFDARPATFRSSVGAWGPKENAYWWTATDFGLRVGRYRLLKGTETALLGNTSARRSGYSLRCAHD